MIQKSYILNFILDNDGELANDPKKIEYDQAVRLFKTSKHSIYPILIESMSTKITLILL